MQSSLLPGSPAKTAKSVTRRGTYTTIYIIIIYIYIIIYIADITVRFELLDQNLLHFSFCASPVSPPKPRPLRFSKAQMS